MEVDTQALHLASLVEMNSSMVLVHVIRLGIERDRDLEGCPPRDERLEGGCGARSGQTRHWLNKVIADLDSSRKLESGGGDLIIFWAVSLFRPLCTAAVQRNSGEDSERQNDPLFAWITKIKSDF
ncbi:hypothetical protein JCGZ_22763 [Jatropha curcas]|uniref:Uncharacterized protein n=1 Tax=Jatropha curcas TaxID=180498 RepID=A0A067L450_JATCU|nr:hypothetical protein JCGZ_22763 [Jatropha curcas]